jgi:carbon storage regulator CsrA
MLVMSRKPQQSITIKHPDGNIVVKVISTSKSQARVGIEAPSSVNILRTEVLDKDLANAKALSE